MDIPEETAAATAEFVTDALREGGVIGLDTRVAEVEHDAIGEGVGIVGQLARLQLRYEGRALGAPGSVILKLPSQYPENRAVAEHFNFYERESRFYQQLSEKLAVRTPRCYWNHGDPATATYGLLLEDLGARTMISQIAGVTGSRATQALATLARLHAAWWASPALDSLDWMPRLDAPVNLAAGEQYRQSWPVFVERIGAELPAGALELGERLGLVFEDLMVQGVNEAPMTICHGDFRADNLMFDDGADDDDSVAVLDWQIAYRGPAITDVAYFLCQSLTVEERRDHESRLVREWYDAVVAAADGQAGCDDYPFDLAWRQYRRAALGTTVYPVTGIGAMDPANERGQALVAAMAHRAFAAVLDLDSAEFV